MRSNKTLSQKGCWLPGIVKETRAKCQLSHMSTKERENETKTNFLEIINQGFFFLFFCLFLFIFRPFFLSFSSLSSFFFVFFIRCHRQPSTLSDISFPLFLFLLHPSLFALFIVFFFIFFCHRFPSPPLPSPSTFSSPLRMSHVSTMTEFRTSFLVVCLPY
ncbi:unnamed protein product [Acanthosepion pharaonis]|uniref:Uncharacterized protein n=1 Tax=Acanthosepion pharaonis TaxID=158019 RepID=A0A812D6B6_ACAPH|nr:unnamed protein product [Sepia pharaonis]